MDEVRGAKAKKPLREIMLSRRDSLPAEERTLKSRAIAARLTAMPELQNAKTVMVYASFRSESIPGPSSPGVESRASELLYPR